ncbi:MAG: helix-turn-helix transcriptional regulator [Kurthia sp.]|nr:helix-turn-helix transcriptional regulator [Candidatus Kurthia equi]
MESSSYKNENILPNFSLSLSNQTLEKTTIIFKALAEPTRLKIIYALIEKSELSVNEIAQLINSSTATASHHLIYLKRHKLACSKRKGKKVYYQIEDEHVKQLVNIAIIHAEEDT